MPAENPQGTAKGPQRAKPKYRPRTCACGVDITSKSASPYCASCAGERGICTTCKARPQDRLGYRKCSRCYEFDQKRHAEILARTGSRGMMPEWRIKQIEECRAAAMSARAEFAETTDAR